MAKRLERDVDWLSGWGCGSFVRQENFNRYIPPLNTAFIFLRKKKASQRHLWEPLMGGWHLIIVSHKWKIVNKEKKYLNNFLHLKPIITTLCWGLSRRDGARQLLNTFWRFYQPRATFAFSEQFLSKLASRLRKKTWVNDFTENFKRWDVLRVRRMQLVKVIAFKSPHIVRQDVKWNICMWFVPFKLCMRIPIFPPYLQASVSSQVSSHFSRPMSRKFLSRSRNLDTPWICNIIPWG